ncbi:B3 domain-containing transcription repressor VAL1-like isoform X2 [Nicotiana tomentosiformis]|uniref:B3 domain-containing transcription repressor VAL1-like isoform X2 n=1 Tax=Nicotiana tomentosiformis TaxID=4098 RepID=UPI00051B082D|nr:B3 domain-containing transcription repressor VAL1-like isoform X6 [Nicotiana tomentosiformis]
MGFLDLEILNMGSMICMNEVCRKTTSSEWKKGWSLKSGGFANLCYNCGSAFENLSFCETFHMGDSGWRECKMCGKHLHCGCIASKYLFEYLDFGGVGCISCARCLDDHSMRPMQVPADDFRDSAFGTNFIQPLHVEKGVDKTNFDKGRLPTVNNIMEISEPGQPFQSQKDENNVSLGKTKQEKVLPVGDVSTCFSNLNQQSIASLFREQDNSKPNQGVKEMYDTTNQPSLDFSLSTPVGCSSSGLSFPDGGVEGREHEKTPFQQGLRTRHILLKPLKPSPSFGSDSNKELPSQTRIARPPAEGRGGRNQLLPRYWPRITDQELCQLSGDLNSAIVPLFEKVLSASDAGRIGRLVLPKACAEAYFPPINQSDGLPIRIQDIKGKEWTFQFRFWPNNNSRMYVLEGVTPCIQNMQLQAGDTVTFSRIDPGGKLVMGFRKATNSVETQDPQSSHLPDGSGSADTSFTGLTENLNNGGRTSADSVHRQVPVSEKKKTTNIGSKNKRLLMHADDAMELRITWEESQELLRPPPTTQPTILVIEDCEFEAYDEPPVFGKQTIFTSRPSGDQEQWAQCDSCSKWRRLPMHVLLPPKWTCSDNIWDSNRCSCSAPEEIKAKELEAFFRVSKGHKRQKIAGKNEDCEPSGLNALATVAVLGDSISDLGEPLVGATTKHPRHRPGCTCIVCIQPPSGKGKHQPTCKCNACLSAERRFKTLMLRKKKKQSEREAEVAQAKDQVPPKDGSETDGASGAELMMQTSHSENERNTNGDHMEKVGAGKGQLDLNCHPNREDEMLIEAAAGISMTSLINAADLPLDMYQTQNGLATLDKCLLSLATAGSEGQQPDNGCVRPADAQVQENNGDNG